MEEHQLLSTLCCVLLLLLSLSPFPSSIVCGYNLKRAADLALYYVQSEIHINRNVLYLDSCGSLLYLSLYSWALVARIASQQFSLQPSLSRVALKV